MLTLPTSAVQVVPGCVHVVNGWLGAPVASELQGYLLGELASLLQPHRGFRGFPDANRLTARLGDPGVAYLYGGRSHKLAPFTPTLHALRSSLVSQLGVPFNCCYVNLYSNGDASLARHSDTPQLPQLGAEPTIVAVSFGVPRVFQLWSASAPKDKSLMVQTQLGHGDLCIMHGRSQADWLHGVPRQKGLTDPRLSITFRFHHPA
jgi:hypothetical protein